MSFEDLFEEMARHNDRAIIWSNFLDYCIDVNVLNPVVSDRHDFGGDEAGYADLMGAWLSELSVKLERFPYFDLLGFFYEECVTSHVKSSQMGQFFSPVGVTEVINSLALTGNDGDNVGCVAYDPACGSARMLLSAHVRSCGDFFCVGEELDSVAARMAVLNFWSHGVRGCVLHVDSLTRDFFGGWRVNKFLYDGIPVPHIELVYSESDALDFIGLNKDKMVNIKDNNNDNSNNGVGGQTTLI